MAQWVQKGIRGGCHSAQIPTLPLLLWAPKGTLAFLASLEMLACRGRLAVLDPQVQKVMLDLKDNLALMGTQVQMVTRVSLVLRVREEKKDAKVILDLLVSRVQKDLEPF